MNGTLKLLYDRSYALRRVERVRKSFHRNGKSYCGFHRIHEKVPDAAVQGFAQAMQIRMAEEQKQLK